MEMTNPKSSLSLVLQTNNRNAILENHLYLGEWRVEGVGDPHIRQILHVMYIILFSDAFLDLEANISLGFTDLLTPSLVDVIYHLILLHV